MSPFRQVKDQLGLTSDSGTSQNLHHAYLLLSLAADLDDALGPAGVTYSDPFREVLHRLESYSGFGVQEVRKLLTPKVK
jgi:hypothetical protein